MDTLTNNPEQELSSESRAAIDSAVGSEYK